MVNLQDMNARDLIYFDYVPLTFARVLDVCDRQLSKAKDTKRREKEMARNR